MAYFNMLVSVEFEVSGTVQGVFFRGCTIKKATELGLTGWVKNTTSDKSTSTVTGIAQGEKSRVDLMKDWLENEGSPNSIIEKCEFTNEREIRALEFKTFKLRRTP